MKLNDRIEELYRQVNDFDRQLRILEDAKEFAYKRIDELHKRQEEGEE